MVEIRDITPHVCAAPELGGGRRRALLAAWIPRPFQRPFERFAAAGGSSTHARLKAGQTRYASARPGKSGRTTTLI